MSFILVLKGQYANTDISVIGKYQLIIWAPTDILLSVYKQVHKYNYCRSVYL